MAKAQAASGKIFPFPTHIRDLANGLRIIVIETGFPDIVSLQIPVSVGSRNEVEPGKSGFAHFFEHMILTKQEALRAALIANTPSPMKYASEKPAAILAEDKLIERYPLALKAEQVRIVPVGDVFEKRLFG